MTAHIKLSDLQESLWRAADRTGIETGAEIFTAAPQLRRAAMRMQSLNEQACNGVMRWDDKARRYGERNMPRDLRRAGFRVHVFRSDKEIHGADYFRVTYGKDC